MPDGKVHTTVSVISAGYATVFLADKVINEKYPFHSFAMVLGCLAGVFLSPDLDVDHGYIGDAIIRNKLGRFPGFLWKVYWWPYAKLVPHRSWVSHLPLISTIIRAAYVFWWVLLIPNISEYWIICTWFLAGLVLVDFNHFVLDILQPDYKKGEL